MEASFPTVPDPWYREGLRFECARCGRCCRGAGNVWISDEEIQALAAHLEMEEPVFRRRLTRHVSGGVVLREQRSRDCVFWDGPKGCRVYAHRPRQCRTYPFWAANLQSLESFRNEAASCPGIGSGPLRTAEEISDISANDGIPAHRSRLRREVQE